MNFSLAAVKRDLTLDRVIEQGFMNWDALTPSELERYVLNEGNAFEEKHRVVQQCTWKYVPAFETARFEGTYRGQHWNGARWVQWLKNEINSPRESKKNRHYYECMVGMWEQNPLLLGPIIAMLDGDADEHVEVGDGNHRVAISFFLEKTTVPVILGTRR